MVDYLPFPHTHNRLLSSLCTLGIGGPARYVAEAHSIEEMQQMLAYSHEKGIAVCILGKGSNALFDDVGYDGLVILNKIDYLTDKGEGHFVVGAGFSFPRLGTFTANRGWKGLEFAAGIPATVGGAIYMNAGAGGQSTADSLDTVLFVTPAGALLQFKKKELLFGYRSSPFQQLQGAIVEGRFSLVPSLEVKEEGRKKLAYRLKTQPYKEKSAGCAFKNPDCGFAGQLIEECGLKGYRKGGAQVSEVHANFIINTGHARADDVLDLIKEIQDLVYQKKGILLETEIRHIQKGSHV